MRELKFRAWDKKEKEYYYDAEYTYDFRCSGRGCYADSFGDLLDQPERFIIEQYTGLKDKNGKEIYEGDIVKVVSEPWFEPTIGIVGFNEEKGIYDIYIIEHNKKYWDAGKDFCSRMAREGWTSEVIGNVHENKELLGGE